MRKATLNFFIDLISFLSLVGMLFTAFLIRYILPPGSGGRGRILHEGGGGEHIKTLWSMSRHEWGDIHFYLGCVFVVLMVVHIILHWTWIKNYFKSILGFSGKK